MKYIKKTFTTPIQFRSSDVWLVIPIAILWFIWTLTKVHSIDLHGIPPMISYTIVIALPAFMIIALRLIPQVPDSEFTRATRNAMFATLWISATFLPLIFSAIYAYQSSPSVSFYGMAGDTGIGSYIVQMETCAEVGIVALSMLVLTKRRTRSSNTITDANPALPPDTPKAWLTRFVGIPVVVGWVVYGTIISLVLPDFGGSDGDSTTLLIEGIASVQTVMVGVEAIIGVIVTVGLAAVGIQTIRRWIYKIPATQTSRFAQRSATACWILSGLIPMALVADFDFFNMAGYDSLFYRGIGMITLFSLAVTAQIATVYGMALSKPTDGLGKSQTV